MLIVVRRIVASAHTHRVVGAGRITLSFFVHIQYPNSPNAENKKSCNGQQQNLHVFFHNCIVSC